MKRQLHTECRESMVAEAVKEVAAELRMVELADYVAFVRLELFANIADIVTSAAELFFQPGTLAFGHGAEAHLAWSGEARVVLDMQFKADGATVYFRLSLGDLHADVDVSYIAFDQPSEDPAANTRALQAALDRARIRPARVFLAGCGDAALAAE